MLRCFLASLLIFFVMTGTGCRNRGSKKAADREDSLTQMKQRLADSVKQEFRYAWESYVKYAWGHDALKPLSHSYHDRYARPLLITPLDGFGTMLLMGFKREADSAKQLILDSLRLDADINVSQSEIATRLLGGLLSAYELDGDKHFLQSAVSLAGRLIKAYHSPTGMPYRFVNLKTGHPSGTSCNPGEAGTSLLEYGALTRLTGDSVYYKTAKKAVTALFNRRSPLTGLVGSSINVESGQWENKESTISGDIDSYYECLLKAWKLFGDQECKRMWDSSLTAIDRHLADTSGGTLWYGHADMDTGKIDRPLYGARDAFFAACLAMGGDTARAKSLQASNFRMWKHAGLEPELLNYRKMQIVNGYYALCPGNLESCYYLYHYTGNPEYLEMGRTMFEHIVRYCRTGGGYASIKDVRNMIPDDIMPGYFLSETLKYAYLLFATEKTPDFSTIVFNTEAHPLQRK